MADLGVIITLGQDVFTSIITFFVYALPFFAIAILLLVGFFFVKKRKVYGIDTIIYTISDNNLIQGRDKGGIVKNLLGLEEFRFRKRKKGCPIPNRKHWIMQDNGRFCIHFYRHSEDDFEPCEAKPEYADMKVPIPSQKAGIKDKIKGLVNKTINPGQEDVPADKTVKDFDIKKQFLGIKFTPIKSDSKQYLNMKAKEIIYKNKIAKKMDQWKPVIMYGSLMIGFIILVIWYFKYAAVLVDKQIICSTPAEIKQIVQAMGGGVKEAASQGFKNPFG